MSKNKRFSQKVNFYIEEEQVRLIDKYSETHGVSMSDIIRQSIDKFFKRKGKPEIPPQKKSFFERLLNN
jgi:hypothetical protein